MPPLGGEKEFLVPCFWPVGLNEAVVAEIGGGENVDKRNACKAAGGGVDIQAGLRCLVGFRVRGGLAFQLPRGLVTTGFV